MLENPTFFDWLLFCFANIIITSFIIWSWISFLKQKINNKYKNIILAMLILTISTIVMTLYLPQLFKMTLTLLLMVLTNYFLFSKNIKDAVITVTISQLIIMSSEFIFAILGTILLNNNIQELTNSAGGQVMINTCITIIAIILFNVTTKFKVYMSIVQSAQNIQKRELFTSVGLLFALAITTTTASYLNWDSMLVLTINMIIVFIFIVLMLKFMNTKNNLDSISNKYETSITSLKEYETLINKNRINNHENKNQLLIIRSMLVDKTKKDKVIDYIDKLVDDKIKDNEKIMYKTAKIPEGGLRATIYSKLCKMDDLKIKYNLDISNDIRTADLIDLGDELTLNICKILGVFLDNAIEAVEHLRKKNIRIEIYIMDGNIHIEITNNFKGPIDIESIGKTGYTTKNGDNHGYGLSLVKQIIDENKHILENKTEINKDNFSQTLIIKM